jgi:hypothetical protein
MITDSNSQKTAVNRINKCQISAALTLDLPEIIKKMKESSEWKDGGLKTEILLNSSTRKIVLTVMHDSTEVESFHKGDSISFKIIEGKLRFRSPVKTVLLVENQLLILRDKTRFTLTSLEDSAFLLTIITGSRRLEDN